MAASTANASGDRARSGAYALLLLAAPLNVAILRALADGPKRQSDLRRSSGAPPKTTLRAYLNELIAIDVIATRPRDDFAGALEYQLTGAGSDLLFVARVLEDWLANAPLGPVELGSNPAKSAIKAFGEGWSTGMLRALAAGPRTLTELDRLFVAISYPSLEWRISALRLTEQVEACPGNGRGTPYAVTRWLCQAVAPLTAAVRWERRHRAAGTPLLSWLDLEAIFLLSAPLLSMPKSLSGVCRLAAELPTGDQRDLAGVDIVVREGEIASYTTRLTGAADASLIGQPGSWLNALTEPETGRLEFGGDSHFARTALDSLHQALRNERTASKR